MYSETQLLDPILCGILFKEDNVVNKSPLVKIFLKIVRQFYQTQDILFLSKCSLYVSMIEDFPFFKYSDKKRITEISLIFIWFVQHNLYNLSEYLEECRIQPNVILYLRISTLISFSYQLMALIDDFFHNPFMQHSLIEVLFEYRNNLREFVEIPTIVETLYQQTYTLEEQLNKLE